MRTRQKCVATDTWRSLGCRTTPLEHWSRRKPTVEPRWAKQQTKKLRPKPTKINSFMSGPSLSLTPNSTPTNPTHPKTHPTHSQPDPTPTSTPQPNPSIPPYPLRILSYPPDTHPLLPLYAQAAAKTRISPCNAHMSLGRFCCALPIEYKCLKHRI